MSVYAKQQNRSYPDFTINELKTAFGILIASGLAPTSNRRDYWSTEKLLNNPLISKCMKRDRFDSDLQTTIANWVQHRQYQRLSKMFGTLKGAVLFRTKFVLTASITMWWSTLKTNETNRSDNDANWKAASTSRNTIVINVKLHSVIPASSLYILGQLEYFFNFLVFRHNKIYFLYKTNFVSYYNCICVAHSEWSSFR